MINEKQLNEEIRRRASFMNDTKWFKLCGLLDQISFMKGEIKFLLDDKIWDFSGFGSYEKTYCDTKMGAFYYKEIEWIFIPKVYEIERYNRDERLESNFGENKLNEIIKGMDKIGSFEYDTGEKGLKIYGYK